jgi:hypothetical protein
MKKMARFNHLMIVGLLSMSALSARSARPRQHSAEELSPGCRHAYKAQSERPLVALASLTHRDPRLPEDCEPRFIYQMTAAPRDTSVMEFLVGEVRSNVTGAAASLAAKQP